jgi:cell division control protein 6
MDDDITSLYISGSPGTGKTALVNSIIRTFGATRSDVKFISVNCMALKSTDALWERLVEELGMPTQKLSTRTKKVKGREAVEAALHKLNTK